MNCLFNNPFYVLVPSHNHKRLICRKHMVWRRQREYFVFLFCGQYAYVIFRPYGFFYYALSNPLAWNSYFIYSNVPRKAYLVKYTSGVVFYGKPFAHFSFGINNMVGAIS